MSKIYLKTFINADIQKVFDLSRDIDFHKKSTSKTNEKAIAGKTSGLIELGETVTWRAKHLGFYQTLTTKIIDIESPKMFTDVMIKGVFKSMKHQHIFQEKEGTTLMIDIFEFESPFGVFGKIFNRIFLENYLKNFLIERNRMIKETTESEII